MASTISFGDANSGIEIGINNAPITAQLHFPPERPETPPSPLSIVPFRRDPDFINRGTILDQIHEKCSQPASRIALLGLGGVGKSQLAIEYCYQIRDRSPETWAFWIHASNAARFEQSCWEIANRVKISGRKDSKADIFELIHGWLQDEKNGKWVIVLDSVDNDCFLHEAPHTTQTELGSGQTSKSGKPLVAYLPPTQNGSIIMTTRSKGVALNNTEDNDIIAIEPMDESCALTLLDKKLRIPADSKDVRELTAALEFMPLAIVQAAAYIKQRAPRSSVRQYIEEFRKNDRKKASLLNYEGGHLRRDHEAKNSIIITWQISFDHVRQLRPSAADLLSLMSFFDRQGIPETLLRHTSGTTNSYEAPKEHARDEESDDCEDSTSEVSVGDEFEDDILVLRDYSFIFVSADATSFEMHGLVQLSMRKWLEKHSQLERWKRRYITKLHAEFPTSEYENWEKCQILFPHAKSAVAQRPEDKVSLEEWASLLHNAASYACRRGNPADAEMLSVKTMNVRKNLFGLENGKTLESIGMIGLVRCLQGRWTEAEQLWIQVMETCKTVLGLEHPVTLTSMHNLACSFRGQGRWTEAEQLDVQVVETRKTVLGLEHPCTLTSMDHLASTFWKQGRWTEAETLEVQVLETRKTVLSPGHPDTLGSMANMASIFRGQGRWEEAETLDVQLVETCKTVLGPEHLSTLISMGNMACTFKNQGRLTEAETLEIQVMKTKKAVLGLEHPDTLASMNNLAFTWESQGQHVNALDLIAECVRLRQRILGPDHPDTLSSSEALICWQTKMFNREN
ncbi:hypothetical protein FQN54_008955 [Arachnomyces sp. PD_36]|nr:hypothetical protein FQN54_008955 [Arachnomyces sp. PD_36]